MNARSAVAALAVLSALTLTGCAGSVESPAAESTAPAATESAAPLVAEGEPTEATDAEAEAAFLVEVRDRLGKIRTQIPDVTDEQLIESAYEACEALAPNLTGEDLSLIDGETRTNGHFMDSSAIIVAARLTMCPIEN